VRQTTLTRRGALQRLWRKQTGQQHVRFMAIVTVIGGLILMNAAMAGEDAPQWFRIDPLASRVWFDADARLSSFRGETQQVDGSWRQWPGVPPRIADARVSIAAASLATGNAERDADMRQDFLEVATFPTIEFTVTDLLTPQPTVNPAEWDLILRGKLTVHGVTREVQVPTTVSLGADRLTARGQVHLDMRDYNIRVPRLFLVPMKSEVLVGFDIVARPER
jgi:polyisoprenoid-binding protein YceI